MGFHMQIPQANQRAERETTLRTGEGAFGSCRSGFHEVGDLEFLFSFHHIF